MLKELGEYYYLEYLMAMFTMLCINEGYLTDQKSSSERVILKFYHFT